MGDQKNMFLAIGLALGVLLVYQIFVLDPAAKRGQALKQQAAQTAPVKPATNSAAPINEDAGTGFAEHTRAGALGAHRRVKINTPFLDGSINLDGARFDDLMLRKYHVDLDPQSAEVELLDPRRAKGGYFANFGWRAADDGSNNTLPALNTQWQLVSGDVLTPQSPVHLRYTSSEDLVFDRTISVDEQYMFTIKDSVHNQGAAARTIAPTALVRRYGNPTFVPKDASREEKMKNRSGFILHQGVVGVLGGKLVEYKYKKLAKEGAAQKEGAGGWLGFTDKYWLSALIAPANAHVVANLRTFMAKSGDTVYEAGYTLDGQALAPGQSISFTQSFFAGAKRLKVLQGYQEKNNIDRFDMAIDWGIFWFLTRPYVNALAFFYGLVGNLGIAIILLTAGIKLLFFPIANKSYASMARMKGLQPKIEELRTQFKDDAQRLQQETMALYQREKVNPLGGCLPMLLQIPVFYALYKTLYISIEMRHAPFFGWIKDLSAPDPTHLGNLFGLIPWDPTHVPVIGMILAIGVWPLLMGLTMGAQQLLNPPPPDPTQRRIFAFMPVIFTIMLAPFAAGLVIYWAWNNFLSLLQQYYITRKNGVETPFDRIIDHFFKRQKEGETG